MIDPDTMHRQRFEVLTLAEKLSLQNVRSREQQSRFRQWVRDLGKPQTMALCFGAGMLLGWHSRPGSRSSSGRLLRWTNNALLLKRLGQRALAANETHPQTDPGNHARSDGVPGQHPDPFQ